MLTPEEKAQFDQMQQQIAELSEWMKQKKQQQISFPLDDASRITMGIGFIGKDSTTTPTGALIVNSPEGPIKILYAT